MAFERGKTANHFQILFVRNIGTAESFWDTTGFNDEYNDLAEARFATESWLNSPVASAFLVLSCHTAIGVDCIMGSLKKKTSTRPLPTNATVGERKTRSGSELIATWIDRRGKKRTATVVAVEGAEPRIQTKSETWYAKYRDGNGIVREIATGCRDKQAAMMKLAELERQAERVRSGLIDSSELRIADHGKSAIDQHLADYLRSMELAGTTKSHIADVERKIEIVSNDCGFVLLKDITAEAVERWLLERRRSKMAARTRNTYLQALNGFLNWAANAERLLSNPLSRVKRADESVDRRRTRRALTESELNRLLFVARWRPLAEYGRETETKVGDDRPTDLTSRKTWTLKPLTFENIPEAVERAKTKLANNPTLIEELDQRGWERSLIYKIAVLTGLRRGEVAALTVEHVCLDEALPFLRMKPQDTKNRQAVEIPLRSDLATDLADWISRKENAVNGVVSLAMRRSGRKLTEPIFDVPGQLVKILDRDLAAAGIPKMDDRGRTVDVHALRHTFGTLLSVAGVAPRTAQQAMRHSDIKLTMNTYTDPRLLDVAGAVDSLPMLPLSTMPTLPNRESQRATGTDNRTAAITEAESRTVAPTVAPNVAPAGHSESFPDNFELRTDEPESEKIPRKLTFLRDFSKGERGGLKPQYSASEAEGCGFESRRAYFVLESE